MAKPHRNLLDERDLLELRKSEKPRRRSVTEWLQLSFGSTSGEVTPQPLDAGQRAENAEQAAANIVQTLAEIEAGYFGRASR